MSPVSISRRGLMVGGVAALGAIALPMGVIEAVAAGTPSVFDPAAFIDDLLSTGHRLAVHQPCLWREPDDDLRPYFWVYPKPGGGFNRAYSEVMARWSDRFDATPDHVERVVAHLRERVGATVRASLEAPSAAGGPA